ncbi:MAG: SRPBCC domain-containing protein [Acidobacteriota bacterium]
MGKARIRIRRPPSEVFSAFADAEAMSKFWFTRRDNGLKEGETIPWFIGSGETAVSFKIRVKELKRPERIVIEWENGGEYTQVTWSFESTADSDTILTIEESGFTGSRESVIQRAIDSTGGFNQVIVAAKALVEYGVGLNLVADHA